MEPIGNVLKDMAARHALAGDVSGGRGTPPTAGTDTGPQADPGCPQCHGRGLVEAEEPSMTIRVPHRNPVTKRDEWREQVAVYTRVCACKLRPQFVVRAPDVVGLGGRLEAMTMATFDASDIKPALWVAVCAWAKGLPDSLSSGAGWLFQGTTGAGKTHLMAAMLHAARLAGVRVRFIEETALIREIQATYHPDSDEQEATIMDGLIAVPVLGIDDLGQGYVPGRANAQDGATWLSSRIYALLNGRLAAGRPTLVTTNLKKAVLSARLGDAAASRMDALTFVPFTGRDRR